MRAITIRIPATTSNIGPGFDTLGIALNLYNTLTVIPTTTSNPEHDPFIQTITETFYNQTHLTPIPFELQIQTKIPIARGLGSSATIRLGLLTALNILHRKPLTSRQIIDLAVRLEGHPDNVLPAYHGGFIAASPTQYFRTTISRKLHFVTLIPSIETDTETARSILPQNIPYTHAVQNIQNTAVITAAFSSKQYHLLCNSIKDQLHQPYRTQNIPGFQEAVVAAEQNGALGAWLSGSGSTIIAATFTNPYVIAQVMTRQLHNAGSENIQTEILKPDNRGLKIFRSPYRFFPIKGAR